MKVKRIKALRVNSVNFDVIWNKDHNGASFDYNKRTLEFGVRTNDDADLWMLICHELWEMVACEMHVRLHRPDCTTEYLFVYDHRQHDTMCNMFSALSSQFIK